MKKFIVVQLSIVTFIIGAGILVAQQQSARGSAVPPPWAYGFAAPAGAPAPGAGAAAAPEEKEPADKLYQLPGSKFSFTAKQIGDGNGPADWFPDEHPTMPDIVAHGSKERKINACGLCHYPNGKGRPTNASVSGLPYSYIMQTLMDFRNGNRKTADTRKGNVNTMGGFAKNMTEDEIKATATYFSSIKWTPWIRVVETDTVPATHINAGLYVVNEGAYAGKEPIGQRIIETPEDTFKTDTLRDPHSGLIAYVPAGSVKKGETLATSGSKVTQCSVCHGPDLEGVGPVPGIAGRSPSYVVRQLFDMQAGTRKGEWTNLMKPVVDKLTSEDMLNLAAYTASRIPKAQSRASNN
jgi:cytochrome c553